MGMTYVQKLLAKACHRPSVAVGEVVEPPVDLAMSHENAALVLTQFREIFQGTGKEARVWDPDRIAIIFDHRVPAESSKTATNQKKVRDFVEQQGIRKFHDMAFRALKERVPLEDIASVPSKDELTKTKFEKDFDGELQKVYAMMDKEFADLTGGAA